MIFKIISFGFLGLTLGLLEPCENTEGLFQCEIDCNEIYADCLASCEETTCMSECSRTHSGCMNGCPCHGECANGCPCNNKYWKGSFLTQICFFIWCWLKSKYNLESSTWQVKVDGLGILEGETYQENYQEVVKFLGVPYAETPKRFEHSQMKTDLGFFEAKSFSFGSRVGTRRPFDSNLPLLG